jgi:NTE family protein
MRKLGLALGGGGARGLAHIGVLKVLEKGNIPIHCIAGTSMGSIVGAAYAAGMSVGDLEREALRFARRRNLVRLADVGLFGRGLLAGKRVRAIFVDKWGLEKTFDELHLPFAAVATNLDARTCVVLREGSVIDSVMASSAFPSVFPSIEINGQNLCDGFIFNNVPANIARQLGGEVIVAVDVIPMNPEFPDGLGAEINNFLAEQPPEIHPRRAPGISQAIYQSVWMMVAAMSETNLRAADTEIVLRPPIPAEVSIFVGFTRAAEAIAAGEAAAEAALPAIRQLIADD